MKEEWRPIKKFGYSDDICTFEVSNFGQVRKSAYTDADGVYHESQIIACKADAIKGRHRVRLRYGKVLKSFDVHVLVAEAFLIKPKGAKCVKHYDNNLSNNRADNLYWSVESLGRHTTGREGKPIRVYSTDKVLLYEFATINEAVRALSVNGSQIGACCRGIVKAYLGLVWKFVSSDDFYVDGSEPTCTLDEMVKLCLTREDGSLRCSIRQYSLSGELLSERKTSASWSSEGIHQRCVLLCCTRKQPYHKNYTWRYIADDELFELDNFERASLIQQAIVDYAAVQPVRQYTIDGDLVGEYISIIEACKGDRAYASAVSGACCLSGKHLTAYGFIWRHISNDDLYSLDVEDRRKVLEVLLNREGRCIRKYTTDGTLVDEFKSVVLAARSVNGKPATIQYNCSTHSKRECYGFLWRYAEDDEVTAGVAEEKVSRKDDDDMSRRNGRKSLRNKKEEKFLDKTRPVRKYSMTGVFIIEYASLYEISMRVSENYNIKMIYKCCMRETASSYNHIWRFADDDEFAKGQAVAQPQSDVSVEPSNPVSEANVVSNPKDTSVPIDVGLDVSEIDIRFSDSLCPSRTMKVLDPNNGRYDVIDLDTQRMETLFIDELFWRKASGDRIEGCSFHTNGLMFELDGFAPYIVHLEVWRDFMVDDAHYLVSNLGRVGRSIDGEFPPQMVTPYENDGVHCRVDLYYGDNYFITYNLADLVARAFLINYDQEARIEFLDGNFMNCAFGNLSCNADAKSFGKVPVEPIDAHMYSTIGEYSLDGALRATYQSVSMAAAFSGHSTEAIRGSCEQKVFTCGSSVFAYSDNNAFAGINDTQRADMFDSFIRQYNNKGELVGEYKSIQAVEEHTGYKAYVIDCACGQTKPKYGFVWRKAKDDEFFYLSVENRIAKLPFRSVRQYTKSGYLLGDFPSVQSAATELGLSADLIGSSAANPQKTPTAEGYAWRYVDSDELYEMPEHERMKAIGYMFIRQYSVDGVFLHEYESVDEAYYASNVTRQEIIESCEKKNKIKKRDFVWRYSHNDELLTLSASDRLLVMSRMFLPETPVKTSETAVEEYEKPPMVEDSMENWTAVSIYNVQYDNGLFKYEVSDKGRVRIRNREKTTELHLLTQVAKQYGGHLTVTLIDKLKVSHTASVDRLVALAFVPKPANCDKVWHKDGDIQNNDASNLTWVEKGA